MPLFPLHFAQLGPSDEWMPFVLGAIMFLIPIIAILTAHQQKMARIFAERQPQSNSDEMVALRAEIARLTQAVHQNTIAIDTLAGKQSLPPAPRLTSEEPPQYLQGR